MWKMMIERGKGTRIGKVRKWGGERVGVEIVIGALSLAVDRFEDGSINVCGLSSRDVGPEKFVCE
jgi:hypothetical protein